MVMPEYPTEQDTRPMSRDSSLSLIDAPESSESDIELSDLEDIAEELEEE